MTSNSITITELRNGDELSDLFINCTTRDDIPRAIEAQEPWSFNIRVNDGEIHNKRVITSTSLDSFKHESNKRSTYEWGWIIYCLFFDEFKEDSKNVEIDAVMRDVVVLEIVLNIGNGIKTQLGSFKLENSEEMASDGEEDEYNLFDWTKEALNQKKSLKLETGELKRVIGDLKSQLDQSLKCQEELVVEMEQKQSIQFKVFTKILNNFQEYNRKLISGEIIETEDQFNQDYIKSAIDDAKVEQEAPVTKKRKIKEKEDNKKKPRKRGRPKKESLVLEPEPSKGENAIQETEIKNESESSMTQSLPQQVPKLAQPEKSLHFQFRDQASMKDEDQDQIPDTLIDVETEEDHEVEDKSLETEEEPDNEFEDEETQDETEEDNGTEIEESEDYDE